MTHPIVLRSYKDLNTYRLIRCGDDYGVAHPGYEIPHGHDWIADCPTMEDASALGREYIKSDRLLATI